MNPFLEGVKQFFGSLGQAFAPAFEPEFRIRHLTEALLAADSREQADAAADRLQRFLRPFYMPGAKGTTTLLSEREEVEVNRSINTLIARFSGTAQDHVKRGILRALTHNVRPDVLAVMAETLVGADPELSIVAQDAYLLTISSSFKYGPFGTRCAQTIGLSVLNALEYRAIANDKNLDPGQIMQSSTRLQRWQRSPAVLVLFLCCKEGHDPMPLANLIENSNYGHDVRYDALKELELRAGRGFRSAPIQQAVQTVLRSKAESSELRVRADMALFQMSDRSSQYFPIPAWEKVLKFENG